MKALLILRSMPVELRMAGRPLTVAHRYNRLLLQAFPTIGNEFRPDRCHPL